MLIAKRFMSVKNAKDPWSRCRRLIGSYYLHRCRRIENSLRTADIFNHQGVDVRAVHYGCRAHAEWSMCRCTLLPSPLPPPPLLAAFSLFLQLVTMTSSSQHNVPFSQYAMDPASSSTADLLPRRRPRGFWSQESSTSRLRSQIGDSSSFSSPMVPSLSERVP
jgi:hypothetical protein